METHTYTHTHIETERERDTETERREGLLPTSLTLLVVCCNSSACARASLVNSWWDVERRWPREDFSFLGLIWQIWGCRCLLGVLGVDVITRSFKAATSPWRISTCNQKVGNNSITVVLTSTNTSYPEKTGNNPTTVALTSTHCLSRKVRQQSYNCGVNIHTLPIQKSQATILQLWR